jgi:hypothetical protein
MGPEPILGIVAWLGIAVLVAFALLLRRKPRLWPYIAFAVLPGLALAIEGAQGQVGLGRVVGLSLTFFAVGTVIVGIPLAALGWWWRNRPASRSGTVE